MLNFRVVKHSDTRVAVLAMDDDKANAVSHAMIDAINGGLDRALQEADAIVLSGRPERFSAGFDLQEIRKGGDAAATLSNRGAELMLRIFTHPQPVVAACTGHALAAGALLLLSCDTRIGIAGDYKLGLNETAIGMGLPVFAMELAQARLSRRHLTAAVVQSQIYAPADAVDAGYLDSVVDAETLMDNALASAAQLGALPGDAYARNKIGLRNQYSDRIRASLKN